MKFLLQFTTELGNRIAKNKKNKNKKKIEIQSAHKIGTFKIKTKFLESLP